jgi:hypothetical protein
MTVFPPARWDALFLEELLTPQEREVRDRVRRFAVGGGTLLLTVLLPFLILPAAL